MAARLLPVALLLAFGLIVAAARGDLWFDEVWSLELARLAEAPWDVFARLQHDNNHPLNTLFLRAVGEGAPLFVYRLLAVLSGFATLVVIAHAARRDWGTREALCSVLLAGTSFPLLLYFSEARGYGPAILCSVVAYTVLVADLREPVAWRLLLFWTASVLGILAHATFALVSLACVLFHASVAARGRGPLARRLAGLVVHQAPPLAALGLWYLLFVGDLVIGGGPEHTVVEVLASAPAYLLGAPAATPGSWLACAAYLGVVALGVLQLRREGRSEWVFFLSILLLVPVPSVLLARPERLYFRYFIVCFPFFYMLLALLLCRGLASAAPAHRLVAGAALAAFLVGQGSRVVDLLTLGRGDYARALAYVAERSDGPSVTIGSDHDFRNRMLVEFYAPRIRSGVELRYVEQPDWPVDPPDWLILHSDDRDFEPQPLLQLRQGERYRLSAEFRAFAVSGWHWFLYRRT